MSIKLVSVLPLRRLAQAVQFGLVRAALRLAGRYAAAHFPHTASHSV